MRPLALVLTAMLMLAGCGGSEYHSINQLVEATGCHDVTKEDALAAANTEAAHCVLGKGESLRDLALWVFPSPDQRDTELAAFQRLPGSYCAVYGETWMVQAWHLDLCERLHDSLGGHLERAIGTNRPDDGAPTGLATE